MRVLWQTLYLRAVFLKAELVSSRGPLIQHNLSPNWSPNVFDGGVASALYETWRRLAYHVTDRIHAKQLLQRLEKVRT